MTQTDLQRRAAPPNTRPVPLVPILVLETLCVTTVHYRICNRPRMQQGRQASYIRYGFCVEVTLISYINRLRVTFLRDNSMTSRPRSRGLVDHGSWFVQVTAEKPSVSSSKSLQRRGPTPWLIKLLRSLVPTVVTRSILLLIYILLLSWHAERACVTWCLEFRAIV